MLNTIVYGLILIIVLVAGIDASGQEKQKEFCGNEWTYGDKVSSSEVREFTLAAGRLEIDGNRNGGISVKGENRSDIAVRACVRAWGKSKADSENLLKGIRIETAGKITARADEENGWGISYEIRVPLNTDLKLTTLNGGISVSDVEGTIEFDAKNGGISVSNLA